MSSTPIPMLRRSLGLFLTLSGMLLAAFAVAAPEAAGPAAAPAASEAPNEKYVANCMACHGPDLKGVDELGINLVTSKFVASKSVPELVAYIKAGRMPDDPASVSGRPMPGFAWIPDAELTEIATYVKSRNAP